MAYEGKLCALVPLRLHDDLAEFEDSFNRHMFENCGPVPNYGPYMFFVSAGPVIMHNIGIGR